MQFTATARSSQAPRGFHIPKLFESLQSLKIFEDCLAELKNHRSGIRRIRRPELFVDASVTFLHDMNLFVVPIIQFTVFLAALTLLVGALRCLHQQVIARTAEL